MGIDESCCRHIAYIHAFYAINISHTNTSYHCDNGTQPDGTRDAKLWMSDCLAP